MYFDNIVKNTTTPSSVITGQFTDNNNHGLISITSSQDVHILSSTSLASSATTDAYSGGSTTVYSGSVPPYSSSIPSSSETYTASTIISHMIPSVSTNAYTHSVSSQLTTLSSEIESSSQSEQLQYSSSVAETSSFTSIQSQPQSANLDTSTSTIPPLSSVSDTSSWLPSTNSYIVSSSLDTLTSSFIHSYYPSSSSTSTTDSITGTDSWSTIPISSSTPSATSATHKSDLPARYSLDGHSSSLSAHSITPSSSNNHVVPIHSFPSYRNSTTTSHSSTKSIKRTLSTLHPSMISSKIRTSPSTSPSPTSTRSYSSLSSSTIRSSFSSPSSSTSSITLDERYSTYTQQYFFTGKTTSFSTGIPITLTLVDDPNATTAFTSITRSTTPVISAPIQVYNKWLNDGQLDDSSYNYRNGSGTNTGTIVGSVVGAVGGIILCVIIFWLFKRRRSSRNNKWKNDRSILRGGGPYTGYSTNEETNNSTTLSHHIRGGIRRDSTNPNDPFKQEFEFDKRNNNIRTPPPIPEPRKGNNMTRGIEPVPKLATRNNSNNNNIDNADSNDNYHLRFSYVSSETGVSIDSSTMGSYSTISSIPNRYGTMGNDKQGFLREIV